MFRVSESCAKDCIVGYVSLVFFFFIVINIYRYRSTKCLLAETVPRSYSTLQLYTHCQVKPGHSSRRTMWRTGTVELWKDICSSKRWFKVEDNKLMYQGFKNGPTVMMNDLRLCEVKNFNNTGCHFCFEVTSSTKSCVLKADSEMTKQIWMRAIQNRETSWTDSSHDSELKDPVREMVKKHKVMNVQAKMREVALRLEMAENPGAKEQQEDEDHKMNVLQNRRPISSNILTAEELDRVCPGRQIGISIVTWNMAGQKELPDNLNDLFPPTTADFSQDMYVIGVQEGCPNREEWQRKLQETLGQRYVMLHAASLGVLSLTIFTRTDLAHYFSQVKDATVTTRFFPRIKTKGSVGVGFTFCGMSFLFITSHFNFSPGVSKVSQRIQDYKKMITGLALPQHSNGTKPDPNLDVTTQYDVVFCFGDFNFRLTEDRESVMATLYHHTGDNMDVLLQHDQLSKEMDKGSVFRGFREAPIHFTPTYKFNMGCDVYDTSSKHRTPSYTDRILYRSKKKKDIKVIQYDSCPTIKTSDHRPVMGTFQVKVQPGTGWYGVHHCPLF